MNAQDLSQSRPFPLYNQLAFALLGAVLITLGAKVQVPFWPVPMTLHVLAIFAIAVTAGPRIGLMSVLAYLGAGAAGLPVFSGTPERGIGLAYMIGPTGGYLVGFAIAAWLAGTLSRGRGLIGRSLAMLAALAVIHALGLAWLARFVPAPKLLAAGFTPFILADLFKVAVVAMMAEGWMRLKGSRA